MPTRAKKCAAPGCGIPAEPGESRCPLHRGAQRRRSDLIRGNSDRRGYGADHRRFRDAVLARDPFCVLCGINRATVADHYPHSRKVLVAEGLDPNDPFYGRGLCHDCDRLQTAQRQNEQGHRYRKH